MRRAKKQLGMFSWPQFDFITLKDIQNDFLWMKIYFQIQNPWVCGQYFDSTIQKVDFFFLQNNCRFYNYFVEFFQNTNCRILQLFCRKKGLVSIPNHSNELNLVLQMDFIIYFFVFSRLVVHSLSCLFNSWFRCKIKVQKSSLERVSIPNHSNEWNSVNQMDFIIFCVP